MSNVIALAQEYQPLLDEIYKLGSLTAGLDTPAKLIKSTPVPNAVLVPKMVLQGLGDYDRNTGFTAGDVTLSWETHTFTQDRGRTFHVDAYDDEETLKVAFGMLAGEFIRTKVIPEVDAYRLSVYASKAGTAATPATLDAAGILAAIDAGTLALDEAEVGAEGRQFYCTPEVYQLMKQNTTLQKRFDVQSGNGTVDRRIELFDGMPVKKVPQTRMYKGITMYDGSTAGQEAGGYIKTAATGKDINFMIIHPSAVVQLTKTALPRIFDPMTNQQANAWKFDYRLYHDAFVPDNKVKGIYLHNKA